MRHKALPAGESYAFYIPGHDYLEDQSVNSQGVNWFGTPRDVLFDIRNGDHYWEFQIACFIVAEVESLTLPNEESVIRNKRDNSIKKPADVFTFEVVHEPAELMYPHCIIQARRNGVLVKKVPSTMKTLIRAQFAIKAEKFREMMIRFYRPGKKVKCRCWDRVALCICKFVDRNEDWIASFLGRSGLKKEGGLDDKDTN